MKGIKACLNWMLDNPMKEIKAEKYNKCRYNDTKKCFQYEATWSEEWGSLDGDDFEVFDQCEWYVIDVKKDEFLGSEVKQSWHIIIEPYRERE